MVKAEGEIIAVAYCVLSSGGKLSGKVVSAPKVYTVAAGCYIE
jgi:hypothetical protein